MTKRILFTSVVSALITCCAMPAFAACAAAPAPGTPSKFFDIATAEFKRADTVFIGKVVNISRVATANEPTLKATLEPGRVFKGTPKGVLEYTYLEHAEVCPETAVYPTKVGVQSMYYMTHTGKPATTARMMLPMRGSSLADATQTAKLIDTMAKLSKGK
jgi:hypothetical protein